MKHNLQAYCTKCISFPSTETQVAHLMHSPHLHRTNPLPFHSHTFHAPLNLNPQPSLTISFFLLPSIITSHPAHRLPRRLPRRLKHIIRQSIRHLPLSHQKFPKLNKQTTAVLSHIPKPGVALHNSIREMEERTKCPRNLCLSLSFSVKPKDPLIELTSLRDFITSKVGCTISNSDEEHTLTYIPDYLIERTIF